MINAADQFRPKKSLGQNFLQNQHICAQIAACLSTDASTNILEVGPGQGALTRHLAKLEHNHLVLIEKDATLAVDRQQESNNTWQCVLLDVLNFAWHTLDSTWVVAGNLPYNIASKMLFNLAEQATNIKQGVFMVQKEVAERICGKPNSKAYGALSIWIQSFGTPSLMFLVPPSAFWPKPKVYSAVITYKPKPKTLSSSQSKTLQRLLSICFQKRRKQLGTILRDAHLTKWEDAINLIGVQKQVRPEQLSVEQFHALAQFWTDK